MGISHASSHYSGRGQWTFFGEAARLLVQPSTRGLGLLSCAYGRLCEAELVGSLLRRYDAAVGSAAKCQQVKREDMVYLLGVGARPRFSMRSTVLLVPQALRAPMLVS